MLAGGQNRKSLLWRVVVPSNPQGSHRRVSIHIGNWLINLCQETWPLMAAGYKLWPFVSFLNHTLIPVEQRTVVGSLVGLGWGVFLALRAAS